MHWQPKVLFFVGLFSLSFSEDISGILNKIDAKQILFYGVTDNCQLFITHGLSSFQNIIKREAAFNVEEAPCWSKYKYVFIRKSSNNNRFFYDLLINDKFHETEISLPLPTTNGLYLMNISEHRFSTLPQTYFEAFYDFANDRIFLNPEPTSLDGELGISISPTENGTMSFSKEDFEKYSSNDAFTLINFEHVHFLSGDTLHGKVYMLSQAPQEAAILHGAPFSDQDPKEAVHIDLKNFPKGSIINFHIFGRLILLQTSFEKNTKFSIGIWDQSVGAFIFEKIIAECKNCQINGKFGIIVSMNDQWTEFQQDLSLSLKTDNSQKSDEKNDSNYIFVGMSTVLLLFMKFVFYL